MPAEDVACRIVAELAQEILALKERIESIDEEIGQRFFARPEARILSSLPGMGALLGAEFLVAVGDLSGFESADRLAAYAGLAPAANDSGKRVGNNKRMRGGNKTLKRSSTSRRLLACVVHRSPGPSTIRGLRVRGTPRRSLRLREGESTSYGRCFRDGSTFEASSAA